MLAYTKISNIEEEIFDCCDKTTGTDTPGGDCCYDAWVKDLVKVTADWKQANADAANKEMEYALVLEWRDQLKGWCTDWEATDEKADLLCRQLELFVSHLEKISMVTTKTDQAIEILFCMVEDLYVRVDQLKTKYDTLIQCINCLKRPEFESGGGIMACLTDYGAKLDAVIKTRDVMITQLVTVLEIAYSLNLNICGKYGLKAMILYWKKKINCKADEYTGAPAAQASKIESMDNQEECCCIEPVISFPIDQDSYVTGLETSFQQVKQKADDLKKDLDAAKEKRDALLACKQSLENAIVEVNPANQCK